MFSQRTRDALKGKKAEGVKLGNRTNLRAVALKGAATNKGVR